MAKGQDLSRYQRGIVRRYYDNLDTIAANKLGELVGELYLALGDEKKSAKLWKSAEAALAKVATADKGVRAVLDKRDVEGLARLVTGLATGR